MTGAKSEDELRKLAIRNLKKKREFWRLLVTFTLISALLVAIWWFTIGQKGDDSYFWPIWPILGFVIALVATGIDAFSNGFGRISERKIQEEIDKLKG